MNAQLRTKPCPACHMPNRLTDAEAASGSWVCPACYARESESISEGMWQPMDPKKEHRS